MEYYEFYLASGGSKVFKKQSRVPRLLFPASTDANHGTIDVQRMVAIGSSFWRTCGVHIAYDERTLLGDERYKSTKDMRCKGVLDCCL